MKSKDLISDSVTLAKGMGNGFPLAAVVTTPEIAQTMGKALHFNTYGGNPMSCAVGSSVLDVSYMFLHSPAKCVLQRGTTVHARFGC